MAVLISPSVRWVGKIDWELRTFHGEELSTHRGTSYNSYLIQDEKTALIDTVWGPFAKEFVKDLKREISLEQIDFIVLNHGEPDHSGALPELLQEIPDIPIYCTANAVKSLKGHYHQDWNFKVVKSGERLSIGSKELVFVEAPMLHWPDTMFTYLTGENILFSTDAFGQHYASATMFQDEENAAEVYAEAIKYYANILTPFSKMVEKKILELLGLNLPLDLICPSHGVSWRANPKEIIEKYQEWARDYQENQITVIYDTMWNGTRRMAEQIAAGIKVADSELCVKVFNSARNDKNDILTEVFKSKAIVVGSPTVNRGILSSVAAILEEVKGLGFKNKKAVAFGSYGWSGESTKVLSARLTEAGFTVVNDGLKVLWHPDEEGVAACLDFGKELAGNL